MPRKPRRPADPFTSPKGSFVSETEQLEFLAAIEKFSPPDEGGHLCDSPPLQARPRRMKQLERGTLKPAETLDLHGLGREEALVRTRVFLNQAVRQGWPAIVIVTGKGLHSPTGPVLRQAVEQLLTTVPQLVVEWAPAPRQYGGTGALVVFLRPQPLP